MPGRKAVSLRVVLALAALPFAGPLLTACGGGGGKSEPDIAFLNVPSFQAADVVFGQQVFVFNDANQGGGAGPGTLACPGMPAVGPLFVPDADNHRVLGFHRAPILSNLHANFVIGQADFDFTTPSVGATSMRMPTAALIAAGQLVVSDTGNHRVLIYAGIPDRRGAAASVVLGQPDMLAAEAGVGAAAMNTPVGLAYGGGRLVVVDSANHRLLVWNDLPTTSGRPADLVLGQADFSGVQPNRGGRVGGGTLSDPRSAWTDGERLVVADRGNNRVLVWKTFPAASGTPADFAVGQPSIVGSEPGIGDRGLRMPSDVHANGTQLLVADAGNHRILIWSSFPTEDFAPATAVLGQSDFEHSAPNDNDQDGLEDAQSSARTLKSKDGVLTVRVYGTTLFVGDAGNHRLLVFRSN